jgi:hypothetical protein
MRPSSLPVATRFVLGAIFFFPVLPVRAQNLTWHSWDPYTDKYHLINSKLVGI